jgi:glutamyl-tRNA reductase
VRDAFEAGAPGPLLDRVFRMALHAGRRARVETAIGESPASIPAAAAALAQQVFDRLDGRRVVLVGAGRMSELTARNLRSRGANVTVVLNRTLERAESLATELGARAASLEELGASLADADVVVASTSAPGLILSADELAATVRARRGRPLLLVDLAVPRDVDPAFAAIDGCFVYDLDDLEGIVSASLAGRRSEAIEAERIVSEEAERFRAWQASLAVVPAIASLRARAEEIRAAELARMEARLGRLPESDRDAVDTVTTQIVNKLLHLPTVRMKEAAVTPDGVLYADVVRHLFGLGEESET